MIDISIVLIFVGEYCITCDCWVSETETDPLQLVSLEEDLDFLIFPRDS